MQVQWVALLALINASLGAVISSTTSVTAAKTSAVASSMKPPRPWPGRTGRRSLRPGMKKRSTSSSSGEHPALIEDQEAEEGDSNSLEIMDSTERSSKEHLDEGWRSWHRKCNQCPDDMVKKWKDPTIKWICGGYQRARRTFKSECMMRYRNCQDGTMFVKLHPLRCNENAVGYSGGRHFLYDYYVPSESSEEVEQTVESSESSDEVDESLGIAFTFDV